MFNIYGFERIINAQLCFTVFNRKDNALENMILYFIYNK